MHKQQCPQRNGIFRGAVYISVSYFNALINSTIRSCVPLFLNPSISVQMPVVDDLSLFLKKHAIRNKKARDEICKLSKQNQERITLLIEEVSRFPDNQPKVGDSANLLLEYLREKYVELSEKSLSRLADIFFDQNR